MIRLIGSVMVAGAAAFFGFSAAAGLKNQVQALDDVAAALRLLEQELELSPLELPVLVGKVCERSRGAGYLLMRNFCFGLEQLNERPVAQLWEEAVEQTQQLVPRARQCLCALGEILGRYDSREQGRAVGTVRRRMEELREELGGQCRLRCKTCQTLGITGGAFLVILLL